MIRSLFILVLIFMVVVSSNAQLTSNLKSIEVGHVHKLANNEIRIPILNQSHEDLSFTMISGHHQGDIFQPDSLNPYELDYFTFSTGQINSNKNFNQKIAFESSEGSVVITIKGQFIKSSSNQDCYDFDKKQVKVKTSGKFVSGTKLGPLVRIYSGEEKNTLFVANPEKVPYAHLVILIDASGSMGSEEKLERIKEHLYSMLEEMRPTDYISILRYSEGAELIVDQQSCSNQEEIYTAIESIEAGGFTDGKNGIESAIEHAQGSQMTGYTNHVIVFTDGAFNLGSEQEAIERYLLGQNRAMNYKLSIMTIRSEKINNKEMKALSKSGNGYHFSLDEDSRSKLNMNKILLKQLST